MKIARRALVAALITLILCVAVSAQTLRSDTDPRNTAPTVGTGGPVGGPTGLFTIYDASTLRRGEFTLDLSYSNYDRDPGNVDLTKITSSFQIGIGDHLELFFNADHYTGIKVNNPNNLSSFYLPNIGFQTGSPLLPSGRSAAIVLAPLDNAGNTNGAVFRPAFNQPFVQFPFVGSSAGTFGQGPGGVVNGRGTLFGFPGFAATLGAVGGGGGRFGAASTFPGIGSPVGGILPGIVLATSTAPATLTTGAVTFPTTFTVPPSYLPDAPFIGRTYGESSYGTFVAGAKIRLTGVNNPFGVAVIPFYRFYYDKANDARGFNQLQRGASPGGNFGDIGVVGVVDGRLARAVNVSLNVGYILNSSVRSNAFGGSRVTLLDRPDELLTGLGFDFPINKHFQPIGELRSTQYVGGRTPNALENSPIDGLLGIRVFPRRYFGFSAAYRRHLNQQSARRFSGDTTTNRFNPVTGIGVPAGLIVNGAPAAIFTNPSLTFNGASGVPTGFVPSDDANGFIGQFFIGHRNARAPSVLPNQPPVVNSFTANPSSVVVCARDASQAVPTNSQVQLTTNASDPDGDTLLYTYTVTGGRVVGEGPNVSWDLSGVQPGTYTSTVEVNDGCGCVAFSSTTVNVTECPEATPTPVPCPTITVSCPTELTAVGTPITFTANVSGGDPSVTPTYNWTVSAGTISGGQGTSSITVDTAGQAGQSITATVNVGGLAASCPNSASCTSSITAPTPSQKFDEYGNVNFNDEKARLDNFAIQLQNAPTTQGYIIAYGGRRGRAGEAQARADRAKNYLVNTRGIDTARLVTVDGGFREDLTVELWLVPQGAVPPTASPTVQPGDVQTTTGRPARRGTRRSRRR